MSSLRFFVVSGSLAAALLMAAPARADAIDGHWCRAERGRMTISGPAIVTPAGTQTRGDYERHAFSYVVPTGEPDAGITVYMVLVNEDEIQLTKGTSTANPPAAEVWHRCPADVS